MSMTPTSSTLLDAGDDDASALSRGTPAAARIVFRLLRGLAHGTLDVQWPDGGAIRFGSGAAPHAAIRLRNWHVCAATLQSGDIGFADSYLDGDWSTPDLVALLALFAANRERIESMFYGSWWGALLHRLRHAFNRNTRAGSRKNIHAHYDLGNAFYRLWLDETMNYSSAWFDGDFSGDLASAQQAKVRRVLDRCGLRRGARLLEIGCGWGAVAETAAGELDAQVVGVTLSNQQLAHARKRMARAGLQADLRLQDYRDIDDGPFDAIVSIEMFEAVGREYWPVFFERLRGLLKPGGRACIQSITIRDDLFGRYVRSTDFIQQYVFPGGLLPSRSAFRAQAARAGLVIDDEFAFGADYAETLRRWRAAFLSNDAHVRSLGFDGRFMRLWEFYLAYCEAAFVTGNTDVVQFTLRRERC